jgi:SAM-dependent methyltransferase
MTERYLKVTGERIVTPEGGFNASWQRHLACYQLTARFLPDGLVLDLGCGIGHAVKHLAPRQSIGVDIDSRCLVDQPRDTVRADMRRLPFRSRRFSSVVCIHAIEHVPDPEHVVSEAARVVGKDGVAVFVTPNRLTFGRPDEIIDPYHFVELDAAQLAGLCRQHFGSVESYGIFGSPAYMKFFGDERRKLYLLLRMDMFRLRRLVPLRLKQLIYDVLLSRFRRHRVETSRFTVDDFELRDDLLADALDVVAVCRS